MSAAVDGAPALSSAFKDRLSADVKAAMKSGEKDRLGALRLVAAAVKQFEVDERREVDDDIAVDLLTRMVKQRRESIAQYLNAERQDLVDREQFELDLISAYLPAQLSADEIESEVAAAISACGATSMRDMGKVMAALGNALKGRADMAAVSARVKTRLMG